MGELRPDRIALYAHAHLPERLKPQRRILEAELPTPAQRVAMLGDAIGGFLSRDYCYVGMDHFALQTDTLTEARREGRLHRNFQGYSAQHGEAKATCGARPRVARTTSCGVTSSWL